MGIEPHMGSWQHRVLGLCIVFGSLLAVVSMCGGVPLIVLLDILEYPTEPWILPVFLALMTGTVMLVGAVKIPDWLELRGQQLKVRRIVQRGGPQTREEYLTIFPGACSRCGSRDFTVLEWEYSFQMDYGQVGREYETERFCARCVRKPWDDGNPPTRVTTERVYSPYLTKEESDSIPDFPFGPADSSNRAVRQ